VNEDIRETLSDVIDPELGIGIVDLGLVYRADWTAEGIAVEMTMTTPSCPLGEMLLRDVEQRLRSQFAEARTIRVDLVWDPPWSPARITEQGRRQLGWPPAAPG
jgi:metal-sulfur cluster biosynthetic enzyme